MSHTCRGLLYAWCQVSAIFRVVGKEGGLGGGGNCSILYIFFYTPFYFPASGQAVATGVVPFSPPVLACLQFLSRIRRIQQSHCSSMFHPVLLTHALVLSASQFALKKKYPRIYTSTHSGDLNSRKN